MSYDAFNAYKQNSVATARPEELTLMLYDGAVKFVGIAKEKLKVKDIEATHIAIGRAQDIINELNVTLDMKYDIAKEFRRLYDFIDDKLVEANIRKDMQALEDAGMVISEMRDMWKEVIRINRESQAKAK